MILLAGVVGNPIEQSLSPAIHNAWISAAGIDAFYDRHPCKLDGFADFIAWARGKGLRGLNVTIPFKEQALVVADAKTPRAKRAGAANVLTFAADGSLTADNTDGEGLLAAIAEQAPRANLGSAPAVVLGAGGAARGAVAALMDVCPEVRVVNRTKPRADALAEQLGGNVRAYNGGEIRQALDGAGLLVNATPQGLWGEDGPAFPIEWLPRRSVVMDMVYKPLQTELLKRAKAADCYPVDGLAMLIGQARPSFEAFFGIAPPDIDIRAVAEGAMT